jgi:enamine deaminase RidA (YjgF/YER057c/UK114 family)
MIIGTSTDTAAAQLSVYSQSTTRPGLKLNMPSGTSGSQEASGVYDNGTLSYAVRTDGKIVYVSGNTGTTVGAAGGASALPATPTGYLQVVIGGTTYKIPYYAN